jgi:hypothetical protein
MLLPLLIAVATAHPGADQRPHAQGCQDLAQMFRRSAALSAEARLDEATAEIDEAARCGADPDETALAYAEISLLQHRPQDALTHLDIISMDAAAVYVARSDALSELDRPSEAADARLLAVSRMSHLPPDLILRTAHLLERADRLLEARAVVDEGLLLSSAASLQLEAIRLAEAHDPEDALRRLDRLPETASWLQRRGDVLVRLGRGEEARLAWTAALDLARQGRTSRMQHAQIATLTHALENLTP